MNRKQLRDAIRQMQKSKQSIDKGGILVSLNYTTSPPDKSEAKVKRKIKTQKRNR